MHNNSLGAGWQPATLSEEYRWSSAKFYEPGIDEFRIDTDYRV